MTSFYLILSISRITATQDISMNFHFQNITNRACVTRNNFSLSIFSIAQNISNIITKENSNRKTSIRHEFIFQENKYKQTNDG